jgi:hypothetical protein
LKDQSKIKRKPDQRILNKILEIHQLNQEQKNNKQNENTFKNLNKNSQNKILWSQLTKDQQK